MTEIDRLPQVATVDGTPRRVGIEVECGGLTEAEVAQVAAATLGGTPRRVAEYDFKVEGTELGELQVMLDTVYREQSGSALARLGLDLSRAVVPVEFVTEPILPQQIPQIDRLCAALRDAGATGTRDGILLGFGVHLNVAVRGETGGDIMPTVRAYGLLEDWLRVVAEIDVSRRALPFVHTWPHAFVDLLAEDAAAGWSVRDLIDAYLTHTPSRNRGLDLLPLLRHLDEPRVVAGLRDAHAVNPRPAFHYRLPDSRIDDPAWSVAEEWNRWCMIERTGDDAELLAALAAAWRARRARPRPMGRSWAEEVDALLSERMKEHRIA